jgi:hypothetical protein
MKYTPGPWKVVDISDPMVYPEDGSTPICLITGMYHKPRKYANAKLIAAAPELLEACEDMIATAEEVGLSIDFMTSIGKMRLAVAKAKDE